MSENKGGNEHRAELPGNADGDDSAYLEHRETVSGNAQQRNELTPDGRGTAATQSPQTHQDTQIDRKGADQG